MPYTANSISRSTIAATSSVLCNTAKLVDDGLVLNDTVSLQTVSTGGDGAVAGTTTATGTALVGTGSDYLTSLKVGSVISDTSGEYRQVASIADDTNAVLTAAFTVDPSGATITVKTGAQVKEVAAIAEVSAVVHFKTNLNKPLDGTDAELVKLS